MFFSIWNKIKGYLMVEKKTDLVMWCKQACRQKGLHCRWTGGDWVEESRNNFALKGKLTVAKRRTEFKVWQKWHNGLIENFGKVVGLKETVKAVRKKTGRKRELCTNECKIKYEDLNDDDRMNLKTIYPHNFIISKSHFTQSFSLRSEHPSSKIKINSLASR